MEPALSLLGLALGAGEPWWRGEAAHHVGGIENEYIVSQLPGFAPRIAGRLRIPCLEAHSAS